MDFFSAKKFPVYTIYLYIYISYIEVYDRNIYTIYYTVHGSDIFIVGLTMKSNIQKKHHNESS